MVPVLHIRYNIIQTLPGDHWNVASVCITTIPFMLTLRFITSLLTKTGSASLDHLTLYVKLNLVYSGSQHSSISMQLESRSDSFSIALHASGIITRFSASGHTDFRAYLQSEYTAFDLFFWSSAIFGFHFLWAWYHFERPLKHKAQQLWGAHPLSWLRPFFDQLLELITQGVLHTNVAKIMMIETASATHPSLMQKL